MKLTPEKFKQRWESGDDGGGITWDDIADCAKAWGITQSPKAKSMTWVRNRVLKKAGTK